MLSGKFQINWHLITGPRPVQSLWLLASVSSLQFLRFVVLTDSCDSSRKGPDWITCQRGDYPMRDLIFMVAPVGLIVYFVLYPDQFNAFVAWAGRFLH